MPVVRATLHESTYFNMMATMACFGTVAERETRDTRGPKQTKGTDHNKESLPEDVDSDDIDDDADGDANADGAGSYSAGDGTDKGVDDNGVRRARMPGRWARGGWGGI